MRYELHLTKKNVWSLIVGICVVFLAIISELVPPEHLGWVRWKVAVVCVAVTAILALFIQIAIQSREDDERDARERERDERDKRLDKFLESNGFGGKAIAVAIEKPTAAVVAGGFYVELYEPIFLYPKVGDLAFHLLEGQYIASGKKPEEATTDCDLLVELYIVNKNQHSAYIKNFTAWLEVGGQWRDLTLEDNFRVQDLWSGSVEYGLEREDSIGNWPHEPLKLPSLLTHLNSAIEREQPITGWLKFSAKDINPKIKYPLRVAVVDSLGTAHYMDKAVHKDRDIALRRVGG